MSEERSQTPLDPNNPNDALKIMRKLSTDLRDGVPSYGWAFGTVYSRVPGEKDTPLFSFDYGGVTASKTVSDGTDGSVYSYKIVHKEVLLYRDLKTGEIIHSWRNPWTGKECKVFHVANDPVNWTLPVKIPGIQKPFQLPFRIVGPRLLLSLEVPLFYSNPLGGEFQDSVGGFYHSMEMFNYFASVEDALDPNTTCVKEVDTAWTRICPWLPWMEMGTRPGNVIYHAGGKRLASFDELPTIVKDAINKKYPEYKEPPPLDDERPNETSWIYYRRLKTGERKYPWDD